MGTSSRPQQLPVKKGKISGLKKLIRETESDDESQDASRAARQPEPRAEVPPHVQADDAWSTVISLCFSVRDWWSALCEELDLTPSQGMALRSLDRPLPMSTLADALACDASNITGIVDKLESRGLIARRGADHDRRVKMLCVTELGRSRSRHSSGWGRRRA